MQDPDESLLHLAATAQSLPELWPLFDRLQPHHDCPAATKVLLWAAIHSARSRLLASDMVSIADARSAPAEARGVRVVRRVVEMLGMRRGLARG